MYKSSYYNCLIPVPELNEYLLFNTCTGGLIALNENEGHFIKELIDGTINITEIDKYQSLYDNLRERGYLVSSELDEIELYKEKYIERTNRLFYSEDANIVLTLATTNACNMECPYCYEFTKNSSVFSNDSMDKLIIFLESVIKNSPIKNWRGFGITWYGGEPLIGKNVIESLTPQLISFAKKNGMEYKADIITNGILLTDETWEMLQKNNVNWAQITIDGPKHVHNKNRPLKNKNEKNYERILENIAKIPDGMRVTIRVNTDKEVVDSFGELLEDLKSYGIWPQRYKNINVSPSLLRTYPQANEIDTSCRIPNKEFNIYYQKLRQMKFDFFNDWASKNNVNHGRLIFQVEKPSFEDCWSIISPYNFCIDADGFTHKCWEDVNDVNTRLQSISEEFDIEKYRFSLNYNRISVSGCDICKYLPVCGDISCPQHHNKIAKCIYKDGSIEEGIKAQYLKYSENPDIMFLKK
ncbi:MAG: radical SAM protein [Bacteroidales bacterium]|nr:radical SAM protein [Bacteroidales bacterium]